MPKLGLTSTEAELVVWHKRVGDHVDRGEVLAEIETDKAQVEVEAPSSGTIQRILVQAGATVDVGTVLALIEEDGSVPLSASDFRVSSDTTAESSNRTELAQAAARATHAESEGTGTRASPAARRLARELGIDLGGVHGSGPEGRVLEQDVQAALEAALTGEAPESVTPDLSVSVTELPLMAMRRATARRVAESARQVASVTLSRRCDMSAAASFLSELRQRDRRCTVTHLVLMSVAAALPAHRMLNAFWINDHLHAADVINLAVAVHTPDGLVAPVVRRADMLNLGQLIETLAALTARARERRLRPEDLADATFTISNLGMYGVEEFNPLVAVPQVATLGVGAVLEEPRLTAGKVHGRLMIRLSLTFDHRAVDGVPAAQFLAATCERLETAGTWIE